MSDNSTNIIHNSNSETNIIPQQEVLDYCKKLYLTSDDYGNQIYSLNDICNELQQKYENALQNNGIKLNNKGIAIKTFDKSTISRWIKKYSWDLIWEEVKSQKKNEEVGLNYQEKIRISKKLLNNVSEESKNRFARNEALQDAAYKLILNRLDEAEPLTDEEKQLKDNGKKVRTVKPLSISEALKLYEITMNHNRKDTEEIICMLKDKIASYERSEIDEENLEFHMLSREEVDDEIKRTLLRMIPSLLKSKCITKEELIQVIEEGLLKTKLEDTIDNKS